jgi:regulator-associated protein of mTOR
VCMNMLLLSQRMYNAVTKREQKLMKWNNSGSTYHDVKIWNMGASTFETPLSTIRPSSSFLYQNRSSPVTGLAFHPHRMMVACSGSGDQHISLFACDSKGGI